MKIILPVLLMFAAIATAEQRGDVEVKGSIGVTSFVDETADNHLQTGGSVRFYLTQRLSFEPEFQYLREVGHYLEPGVQFLRESREHYDAAVLGNFSWDFRPGERINPYVTGGVGWIQSTTRLRGLLAPPFPPGSSYTVSSRSNAGIAQFGVGTKIRFGERWYIAPEFRLGVELHARANFAIGYTFPR